MKDAEDPGGGPPSFCPELEKEDVGEVMTLLSPLGRDPGLK